MKVGDRFNVTGYDIVATAQAAEGGGPPDTQECVVMHNNSSHYLVAKREVGESDATLLGSFPYANVDVDDYQNPEPVVLAYLAALDLMVRFVKAH